MASIIDKYLDQIKKNLKKNSVDKEYIEELAENLGNQLYTQLEEVQQQNVNVSLEDAEIQVLTNCEPVEILVRRVINELRADEPRVKWDHFTEVSILQPIEQIIITVMKQLDKGLLSFGKKIRSLKEWYLRNENPLLTSVFYLLLICCSTIGLVILSFILPPIIYATTFPNNKSYIFLYDVPSHVWNNPEISSISITPLSIIITNSLIFILAFVLIAHLGWKYSTIYAIKTVGFLSVSIILLWSLTITNYRFLIKNRTADLAWGISTTPDWVRTQKFSVHQYSNYLLSELTSLLVYGISTFLILILLGSIIRKIVKERPSLYYKRNMLSMVIKIGLILIFISSISNANQWNPQYLVPRNSLLPSYSEQPMLYRFDIDWTKISSSRNSSENYLTILSQFGGISFYFNELYNVSLQNTEDFGLSRKGYLSTVINESEEPSTPSQETFPILGLLYLPPEAQNQEWLESVITYLNSSYPFSGYTPNTSSTLKSIEWHANNSLLALEVNTLVYSSITNASVFTLSFDASTGWLMQATLTLDNQSWVSGWNLETLTITRAFLYNQIQNPNDYYIADTFLSCSFLIGTIFFLCVASIYYYYKRPRSQNKQTSN